MDAGGEDAEAEGRAVMDRKPNGWSCGLRRQEKTGAKGSHLRQNEGEILGMLGQGGIRRTRSREVERDATSLRYNDFVLQLAVLIITIRS